MNGDILIRGGWVIDPARSRSGLEDLLVQGVRIAAIPSGEKTEANQVIDATDCLVLPGLIDFHAHLFARGTEIGVFPDPALLPQGVTTAVDGGSAGIGNFDSFVQSIIATSQTRILGDLNVSPTGIMTDRYHEDVRPHNYDLPKTKEIFARYKGKLLALKIRQSCEIVGEMGLAPLRATLKMAEAIGCPVVVHITNPPSSPEELAALLRPGDVFCHVYHGKGQTILSKDGKVLPGIRRARQRGVIFDAANGRSHFSLVTAHAAIADGFFPDVLSTDLTVSSLYGDYAFGLPYIMSKYLNLGMPLEDVVAACTATPAKLIGLKGTVGTLAPGAFADIAVFRLKKHSMVFLDSLRESFRGEQLLIPQLTIIGGKVVYRQIDFW